MSNVTIITHFSQPNWPVVNKLSAICKCLEVNTLHCPNVEKLEETLKGPPKGRNLFFTDEGLIDFLNDLDQKSFKKFDVALFIMSPILKVVEQISNLKNVKYLISVQPAESFGRDLSILIKKFSEGDILDLEKYLAFGSKVMERTIDSSLTKKQTIEAVTNYILRLGDPGYNHPFGEYAQRIALLTDELLLNAVFDANPRLKGTDRSVPFKLKPKEKITVSFGYDGEFFGVSVRDPFGSFTSDTILKYLAASKETGKIVSADSGGLGLRFIFEKAHQVVTNVKSEKVTEVIALVKFPGRIMDFESQKKSFYFFENEKRPVKKSI